MSMQSLVEDAVKFAKDLLQKSPTHQLLPMAICFGPDGHKVIPGMFDDDDAKHEFYRTVGAECRTSNLQIALLVNDAAMREVKTDKEAEFIKANYDTESPLSYPKSMRTECIIALGFNFATEETFTVAQPYREATDGAIEFHKELMRLPDAKSALVDNLKEGWKEADVLGQSNEKII